MLGRDGQGPGMHGEGNMARRGRGQLHAGGGPHISESSHLLGQPLSLHHIPAALTQPRRGCFYLLGQALAHLSGLQGGNRMVRTAWLTFPLQDRHSQPVPGQDQVRNTEQSGPIKVPNNHNRCQLPAAGRAVLVLRYEHWFCCWASPGLRASAVCSLTPIHTQKPPRPCCRADLLGLLPSDGQQAGGTLGELALPDDD